MSDARKMFGPVLVGMRGSGKSSVGPALAELIGMNFADSDREVENRLEKGIAEIFREKGEAFFRSAETETMLDLLGKPGLVVSAGGGAVLDAKVREMLKRRFTVWLHAPIDVLASRIEGSARPSLTGKPIAEELSEVLAAREAFYREVSCACLNTAKKGPLETAKTIGGIWSDLINLGGI